MSLLESSRVTVSTLCFYIYCLIGRRNVSISSAALNVALYAPLITLAALACKLCSVLSILLVYSFPFILVFDHIKQAYIICGSTVPSYIRRRSRRLAPQLDPPRLLRALIIFITFRLISSVCSFQCSFTSIVSPRYLHVAAGRISPHSV
jgi:hypothetical protein